MGGITHHANGRRQPFSDSTTRGFRGKTVALVDTGVVGTRPTPLGLPDAVTAGGIPRGRVCAPATGDIPRGQVRVLPGGDLRRRRGPESCPPTRSTSPAGRKCTPPRSMSPQAEEGRTMWTVRIDDPIMVGSQPAATG